MLALVALSWWRSGRSDPTAGGNCGDRELRVPVLAATVGCVCLLPATWLVMMMTSGYYLCRYGIGTVAGLAILTCLLTRRSRGSDVVVPLVISGMLMVYFAWTVRALWEHRPELPVDRLVYNYRSDLPVVVNDPYRFLPMWWYASGPVRARLIYLKTSPRRSAGGT